MISKASRLMGIVLSAGLTAACQTTSPVHNAAGSPTVELDVGTRGPVAGVGIESQDIVGMTDRMMRDMLANPRLANAPNPPQVIIDASNFDNESSQRINKNLIVERLRIELTRSANGRMVFISQAAAAASAKARDLKRQGITDVGTRGLTRAVAGADYQLIGKIMSHDQKDSRGMIQRYNLITFEMIDLERSVSVWANQYEFKRAAADDVVYR